MAKDTSRNTLADMEGTAAVRPDITSAPGLAVSLVVPFLNEEKVLPKLFGTLAQVLPTISGYRWELVLVDDGSTDSSVSVIVSEAPAFPGAVRLVRLTRNFGHQPALMAGLARATGAAIICLDADLQDPPELVAEFLARFQEGHDVVFGVRRSRKETLWKRFAYRSFYRLFRAFADVDVPLDAGDFGLMSRRVVELVLKMPERDLIIRGLRSWVGFRQIGVPYDRPERQAGETKYGLRKLVKLALSALFGYSTLPLRLATVLGLGSAGVAACYAAYVLYAKFSGAPAPSGWASLAIVILFLGGVQLVTIGILGEYIGRIYQQSQARPLFIIAKDEMLTTKAP